MPYTALCTKLDSLATRIWKDVTLVRGGRVRMQLGEVTVTERLHLDLLHSGQLNGSTPGGGMVIYDVPDEPKTGADWEWLVQTAPGSPDYLHYRIQAKILHTHPGPKFKEIDYAPRGPKGSTGPHPSQRQTLLSAASLDEAFPLYAFYIGDPWPSPNDIALPTWQHVKLIPQEHFGCAVLPAVTVDRINTKAAKKRRTGANQYLKDAATRRLSDLFPDPYTTSTRPPTTPNGATSTPSGGSCSGPGPSSEGGRSAQEAIGPPILDVTPKELTPDQQELRDILRNRAEAGRSLVLERGMHVNRAGNDDPRLRLTAFFTA